MSNAENVPPQTLRAVVREVRDLVARPPPGIKLAPPETDLTDIRAAIDGPVDTPYEGGVFWVRVSLGRSFPAAPPRAYFLTKIFHPNVASSGEICVDTLKKDWKPDLGIKHILLTIKCLLIVPNPESALNAEAGALLLERYDDYFRRARLLTDIHASAASTAAAASTASAASASDKERAAGEGPCAKRERRPAGEGEGPAAAPPAPPPAPAAAPAPAPAAGARAQRAAKDKRRILKRL